MNIDEKMFDAFKGYSKLSFSLMSGVLLASGWIIQRASLLLIDLRGASDKYGGINQAEFWGLEVPYIVLSMVYPIALGVICTTYGYILTKEKTSLSYLLEETNVDRDTLLLLNPYSLLEKSNRMASVLWVVAYIPLSALALHMVLIAMVLRTWEWEIDSLSGYLPSMFQFVGLVLGTWWTRHFHKDFRSRWKSD